MIVAIAVSKTERVPADRVTPRDPSRLPTACDFGPSWSPDGKYIAFSRMTSGNARRLRQAEVDGGGSGRQSTWPRRSGPQPRWSPDGRTVWLTSSTQKPGSSVFLVPPDGGTPRELIQTDLPALDYRVEWAMGQRPWSADGKTLLVSRATKTRQGRGSPGRDSETGEAEQITFPPRGL